MSANGYLRQELWVSLTSFTGATLSSDTNTMGSDTRVAEHGRASIGVNDMGRVWISQWRRQHRPTV